MFLVLAHSQGGVVQKKNRTKWTLKKADDNHLQKRLRTMPLLLKKIQPQTIKNLIKSSF